MSTLRLTTISNQSGSASVPSDTVINGSAKAWVNFNGAGTVAIRAAFNVSSITDVSTGNWTVNFANALPDSNYASVGTNDGLGGGLNYCSASGSNFGAGQRTTTACSVATLASNGAGVDTTSNYWAFFR